MKKTNITDKLEWYVYKEDFNRREIKVMNIFDHWKFAEDVEKLMQEPLTKEEFTEKLRRELFYYYGGKCEMETVITSWPPYIDKKELDRLNTEYEDYNKQYGHYPYKINVYPDVGEKIDIAGQVQNNMTHFVNYLWDIKTEEDKPKIGKKVYVLYNQGITVENIGYLGKESFVVEYPTMKYEDAVEWFYEDYNKTWFTHLTRAKNALLREAKEIWPDVEFKVVAVDKDRYELEEVEDGN